MLYITTRDSYDAHTAYKTMLSDRAPDGGLFIPLRMPVLSRDELLSLKTMSFGDIVADILNRFFSAGLSGWAVECAIGRNCVKTKSLGQKNIVAELWHNPERRYSYLDDRLFDLIADSKSTHNTPTDWCKIAISIATLFGVYGLLLAEETLRADEMFHLSLRTADSTKFSAVWYAREMGLPISMTLCADTEECGLWDFVHRGELNTATMNSGLALGIERLVHAAWGIDMCRRYLTSVGSDSLYAIGEDVTPLSEDIFCSVIGNDRIANVINSVYRNSNYLIDAETAQAMAAIQDYRAKIGENRITVFFAENDPVISGDLIAGATGLSAADIAIATKK